MKNHNFFSRIKDAFSARPLTVIPYPINQGLAIYQYGNDDTYINKGYNKNAWVYAIVSKCAKKFSQVNWYHYKIKNKERKTWFEEYIPLTKDRISDPLARLEARKMRKKSVDQVVVDDALSKFIARPNRNMSGAQFREQLYGYQLLTGEGNIWFPREAEAMNKPPVEMYIIPKKFLALVAAGDPWTIAKYKVILGGNHFEVVPENMLMWRKPNYNFDAVTLSHLRGRSPLDAGLLMMQASNEGTERLANINKNQGVAGMAYNKSDNRQLTVEQAKFQRQQFNSIINDKDLAGTIAAMTGDWGFMQFGMSVEQLQLLEQSNATIEALCNIFDVPPGVFTKDQTYDNRKEQKREFIYDNIAVASYQLRDELNGKLIREFGLDRERDVIDCDIMALPELADDLKTQADTLKTLWQLTPNQALEYLGYDRSTDPNMDKVYIPANLVPLDQANSDIGASLDQQMNDLNL